MIAFIDLPAYRDNVRLCSLHDKSVLNSVHAANVITSCNMESGRWCSAIKADLLSVCLVVVIIAAGREENVGFVCISKMMGIRASLQDAVYIFVINQDDAPSPA